MTRANLLDICGKKFYKTGIWDLVPDVERGICGGCPIFAVDFESRQQVGSVIGRVLRVFTVLGSERTAKKMGVFTVTW